MSQSDKKPMINQLIAFLLFGISILFTPLTLEINIYDYFWLYKSQSELVI